MDIFEMYLGNRIKKIYFMDCIQDMRLLKVPAGFCLEFFYKVRLKMVITVITAPTSTDFCGTKIG